MATVYFISTFFKNPGRFGLVIPPPSLFLWLLLLELKVLLHAIVWRLLDDDFLRLLSNRCP
jgi:hypothetical protein